MAGKSDRDAALQEAFEEAGIIGSGSVWPIGSYPFSKAMHDGTELQCTMAVFGMADIQELDAWPEMEQRERRWVDQAEAIDMIYDWNLARFVANITLAQLGVEKLAKRRDPLR